jgi:hypothetical protein
MNILLTRAGNLGEFVSVVLSSPGSPEIAVFQETISFGPNVTSQSVSIPIHNDLLPGEPDAVTPLSLSSPAAGASVGAMSSASLVIHDDNPALVVVRSLSVSQVKVGTGKKAKKTTGIVVQFTGALDLTPTLSLSAFHLLSGKTKKGHTTYNKTLPLSMATYSASAKTITLVPKSKLNQALPEQLTITAALLKDSLGRTLDGNRDGQPGGDFVSTLPKKSITFLQVQNLSSIGALTAAAFDSLIESGQMPSAHKTGSRRLVR